MSVDSENKSSEARIAPYSAENGTDDAVEGGPVTPEMVLRLPTITDSMSPSLNATAIKCCLSPFHLFHSAKSPSRKHNTSFSEYLCSPEANIYDIDFTRFQIRDLETGAVLFEITKPPASGNLDITFFKIILVFKGL